MRVPFHWAFESFRLCEQGWCFDRMGIARLVGQNGSPLGHSVRGHPNVIRVFSFKRGQLDREIADGRTFG